jgi:hypothetical protein
LTRHAHPHALEATLEALASRVDEEIVSRLRELANAGESSRTVLRRVLGLPRREQGRRVSTLGRYDERA